MSPIDAVLSHLEGHKLRKSGSGWVACCPAHEDRSPSLSINETDSGSVLLHCFGGCSVENIVGAMGLCMQDLFPPKTEGSSYRPRGPRISAAQALQIIKLEVGVVWMSAKTLAAGKPLAQAEIARLDLAATRITSAMTEAGL